MKSNLAIMTLKALLAISAVTTFVACSSNAQTRSPAGTQDVGGGNGLTEGKIYEAYIVDVTTLKAFQKYVKPAFEKMDPPAKEGEAETENGFYQVARMKTWYIAPVSLKPLSKEAIGFSASESKNVQFAVQTKDKVVIDKTLFDKMTIEEQGRLIMHEMVMSLFLVKYMSIPEMQASACSGGYCTQESQDNSEKWKEYFEAAYKPLPYKPLSKSDYEHIRAVTAWFFSHAAKPEVTRAQIFKVLIAHDFDKRFFLNSQYDDKGEKKTIEVENSQELMMKATRRAQALGTMPDRCYGLRTKVSFPCKLTMQKGEDHVYTTPFFYIQPGFEITLASEKVNRKIHGYYGSKSSNEVSSNSLTEFVLYENHLPETCLVGERVDDVVALLSTRENIMAPEFNVNNAPWDYEAFIFQPKVITGELESDESPGVVRIAQDTPRVTSIENDTVIVYSEEAKLEQTRAFATSFMNGFAGNSQCRPKASK